MQPNQELNALIITDESHRRHKEMQSFVHDDSKEQELRHDFQKVDFVLALNEEDFKAKDLEMVAEPCSARAVPKMPDFDMKMMPTFRDLIEDKKSEEAAPEEFTLADKQWSAVDWWRQMDPNDETLMYQLGMFASTATQDNPIYRRHRRFQ